jgi:hypothetical protein
VFYLVPSLGIKVSGGKARIRRKIYEAREMAVALGADVPLHIRNFLISTLQWQHFKLSSKATLFYYFSADNSGLNFYEYTHNYKKI